jgi:aryl-alcohol dehydrogenase-like predicted oxidoreductase
MAAVIPMTELRLASAGDSAAGGIWVSTEALASMKRRLIPNSALEVSTVCLGTMTFGNPVREPQAIELVHWALDHGINFFDTADVYEGYDRHLGSPGGVAEDILGKALIARRDQAIVATKVGNPVRVGSQTRKGLGAEHIRVQLEASLRRLRTDHVDVYEFHRPDPDVPLAESVAAMNGLIRAGKVRHWGISNFEAQAIREIVALCEAEGWLRPVVNQPAYNWLKRDVEREILPVCRQFQIAVTPYQPLQGGLLTGKYRRGFPVPPSSRAAESTWLGTLDDRLYARIDQFLEAARQAGCTPTRYALGWLLDQPGVVSVVVGTRNVRQLEEALAL